MEPLLLATVFTVGGWNYHVWVDQNGKITHIRCEKRYSKTDARFIGDDWIVSELQRMVTAILDD